MGYKANIDIALSFSNLKICSIRQQGRIKFRVCLYYTHNSITNDQGEKRQQVQYCHPYSIIRKSSEHKNSQNSLKKQHLNSNNSERLINFYFPVEESELDLGSQNYISKPFKIIFQHEVHQIMETCCFRMYIDIQKYEQANLKCQVQLMFCANALTQQSAIFKTIGRCDCKIRKLFDVSTYLPIVFDEFEGVSIEGIYQSALIDFKYERDANSNKLVENPQNFYEYLKNLSGGFNRSEIRNFYRYYRQLLEKQLFSIQERHYDLLRILKIRASQQFRVLKINTNTKIQSMIDHLGGYNSQQSIGNLNNKRSLQYSQYANDAPKQKSQSMKKIVQSQGSQKFKKQLSQQMVYDFLSIKAHIHKKWCDYLDFTSRHIVSLVEKEKNNYNLLVKERLSGNVFSHKVNSSDWKKSIYEDSGREHLKLAEADRKKSQKDQQLWKQAFIVQNQGFFAKDSKNIKIFEQLYLVNPKINVTKSQKILLRQSLQNKNNFVGSLASNSTKKSESVYDSFQYGRKNSLPINMNNFFKGFTTQYEAEDLNLSNQYQNEDHFIILVHGFQASRQDFIILKNCLQIRFKAKVLISTSNEGRTDDQIEVQGKRLAFQLQRYLNQSSPSFNYRLSFIGHSMGGIVIRTALCYLQNVGQHLYSFITFSTPHLGYMYQPSTHIQAGLWLLGALQKTNSIQQLCVRDKQNLRLSFLYRLSQSKSIDKFKHISFVGSSQDKYVPYQSSRVQHNQKLIQQNLSKQSGKVINQMIQGILGSIQCKQLSRIDVIFNIQQSNFDTMIGRTAHIKYLSDRQFIKVFCIVFDKFFK